MIEGTEDSTGLCSESRLHCLGAEPDGIAVGQQTMLHEKSEQRTKSVLGQCYADEVCGAEEQPYGKGLNLHLQRATNRNLDAYVIERWKDEGVLAIYRSSQELGRCRRALHLPNAPRLGGSATWRLMVAPEIEMRLTASQRRGTDKHAAASSMAFSIPA